MKNTVSANVIGIFDSGVGGLSVLREIHSMLPAQPLYFIADQAHVPYGKREMSEIQDFSFAITDYFASMGARMIVVACNTASAAALKDLRKEYPELTFVGMEPAVKPATQTSHNGIVGVLATPATFQGKLYNTLVEKFAKDVKILTHTCPGLVEAIESGELSNQSTRLILQQALLPMIEKGADTIVLGCTHFPFVVPTIKEIVGPNVNVIDPSPAIAKRVSSLLNELDLLKRSSQNSDITYGTTGEPEKFKNTVRSLLKTDISPVPFKWIDGKINQIDRRGETMPQDEIVFDPVDHITIDALGKPGQRVFYIQATKGEDIISLIIEKFQLQSLLEGTQEFFDEIYERFPKLVTPNVSFQVDDMRIQPPVDTIFRAGDMGLAYDENRDLACIFAREGLLSGESGRLVRFWCTRAQLVAVAQWGKVVLEGGRSICPQCGQPMEPDGHFCPKKNGHKH